jgi:hypothetical protein
MTENKHTTRNDLDNYILEIMSKQEKSFVTKKKQEKHEKNDCEIVSIPSFGEHFLLSKYNYNVQQLKTFAKFYKLKITGNKQELIGRLYNFLFLSSYILKIQKIFRGHLQRLYNNCRGPACLNRSLCTNACDFFTMDDIKDISIEQFFSYKDDDGFIYGFDLMSLYNLINKGNGIIKNPYNRRPITPKIMKEFKTLFHLSSILKVPIHVDIKSIDNSISNEKTVELRALELFQTIDSLGNYSHPQWFMSLNRNQLIKFLRELIDIWTYRAQLPMEVKKLICPPLGDPFHRMGSFQLLQSYENINDIRKNILVVLEKMINSAVDRDNRSLGAYYVLAALTLVNTDASNALPWLYQSVAYF